MFEKLKTPEEIFSFKLGSALTMEKNVLGMLGSLQEETKRDELRQLFAHHAEETQGQIANIAKVFELLGEEVDDSPCRDAGAGQGGQGDDQEDRRQHRRRGHPAGCDRDRASRDRGSMRCWSPTPRHAARRKSPRC